MLPQFDRSQVAQHNDDARGYWLIINELVYDVTDFMRTHPGGDRILQLYAGRDATHGFERVHKDRAQVALHLRCCCIGVVRRVDCAADPEHAAHHAAFRAFDSALQLVVEMQNALSADHSFQLEPLDGALARPGSPRSSRYELQRGVEAHARFHREYLDVLIGQTLAQLGVSTLSAPEIEFGLRPQLESLQCSPEYVAARAWALELFEQLERFTDHELAVTVACFEVLDSWLLRAWKRELSRGLRVFERAHTAAMPRSESRRVYNVCERLLEHLGTYFRSAGRAMAMCAGDSVPVD
jgi:cytochrome b involved in lipid metabolism